jgi:DNA-binding CsgD family transcriptional regulator
MAYSNVAALWMHNEEYEAAVEWGTKAMELARQLGDPGTLAHALTNVGYSRFLLGEERGRADLEHAIAIAAEAGLEEHVVRGSSNLGGAAVELRQYAAADRWLEQSIDHIAELGVSYWRGYPLAMRARSAFEQGRWDDAVGFAEPVLARPLGFPLARLIALVVLGRVRTRRGDPGVRPALDEASAIAAPTRELQQIAPVAAARAEASLLAGDADAVAAATEEAFQLARLRRSPWTLGELACLRRRAGIEEPLPEPIAEPYALELAGEWAAAASRWEEIGCRYEAAGALAASGGEEALRRAHAELEQLGARPAASAVARTLRALVARGPRAATTRNPANLTPREVEVLSLIAQGLRNADIAQRLVVSQRTVDHHVSAILRKLGVRSRAEAGVAAVRLGIAADTSIATR